MLALGIGATTAIFSVADALLVRQLPYRDPDRIVLLFEAPTMNRATLDSVAPANVIDWQERARSLELVAAVEPYGFTYTGGPEPQSFPAARVTQGFFEVFGVAPLYGRTFTPEDYTAGRNQVVVLSHGTWAQRFGAEPGIVGRVVRLNGQPHTVVGVMPATFAPRLLVTFNERGIWSPRSGARPIVSFAEPASTTWSPSCAPASRCRKRNRSSTASPGGLAKQYPRTNAGQTVQIVSLRDHLAGGLRASIGVLTGAVVLLLAIAMANTANLLMARAAARGRRDRGSG